MPVITVKGFMEFNQHIEMLAWHDAHMTSVGLPDFDQFLIECAVRGFEEVKRHV